MYLLDTNTVIYWFKGLGRVGEHLQQMARTNVALPMPVLYELEVGIRKISPPSQRRRLQLDRFLSVVRVLPFNVNEARAAASIRVQLEKQGMPIGPIDTLIAGTALAHGATLVTRNTGEFGRASGLVLENWYD